MSGTIPLSLSQQFDIYGKPLAGGQLYLIQAGTVSTPQNGFQDGALAIPLPNPITLDAAGRIPQFFLADGLIKVRLQDKAGVVQLAADGIQVIGPSSGGGGGGTAVDPNALIQTGNMIFRYGFGALAGYVRLNGLTVGSASSGATERGNADCQPLFQYLWGVDPNLAVSGGRGATAIADWTANKQLSLPDWRGCVPGAMDGMGNVTSGRLTSTYFGSDPTALGALGGAQSNLLGVAQLPAITPVFTGNPAVITVKSNVNNISFDTSPTAINVGPGSAVFVAGVAGHVAGQLISDNSAAPYTPAGSIASFGGGQPHASVQPTKLCTFYIKL